MQNSSFLLAFLSGRGLSVGELLVWFLVISGRIVPSVLRGHHYSSILASPPCPSTCTPLYTRNLGGLRQSCAPLALDFLRPHHCIIIPRALHNRYRSSETTPRFHVKVCDLHVQLEDLFRDRDVRDTAVTRVVEDLNSAATAAPSNSVPSPGRSLCRQIFL